MKKYLSVLLIICLLFTGCMSKSKVDKKAQRIVNEYNNEYITYEQAIDKIDNLSLNANNDEKKSIIDSCRSSIDELKKSKDAFSAGEEAYENKKYDEAIGYYGEVIESDCNYNSANRKKEESENEYVNAVYDQVNVYLEEKKFDKAVDLYNKAKEIVKSKQSEDKISDLDSLIQESLNNYIDELNSKSESELQNEDYETAKQIYEELYELTGEETYSVKIEGVENEWSNSLINAAEEQLAMGKYDAALNLLKEPKRKISDDSAITEEERRIESFRPLVFDGNQCENYLYTDIYTTYINESLGWHYWWIDDCGFGDFNNVKDNLGQKHDCGILLRTPNGYDVGEGSGKIDYTLKGDYDYFDCVFFIADVSKNTPCEFNLNIYGDDILIYSSDTITGGSLPIDVSTSIKDVQKLTIEVVYDLTNKSSNGDYIVVSDMRLRKEYSPLSD